MTRLRALTGLALMLCVLIGDVHGKSAYERGQQHLFRHKQHHKHQASNLAEKRAAKSSMYGNREDMPIRIHVEFQFKDSNATASTQQIIRDTVNLARASLAKYLKVKGASSNALLVEPVCVDPQDTPCSFYAPDFNSTEVAELPEDAQQFINTCGMATVNADYFAAHAGMPPSSAGKGHVTDFYLYVTSDERQNCEEGTLAWALPCYFDSSTTRPVMGAANICPAILNQNGITVDDLVGPLTHELLHALGFTDYLFDSFVDDNGKIIESDKVYRGFTTPSGNTEYYIVAPKVVEQVRKHFNCPSMIGAKLENEGGSGSAGSHWEYRLFQGDIMVPADPFATYGGQPVMSSITLAYFESTGWYNVVYENAGLLDWGKDRGCDFAELSCEDYINKYPNQTEYCTDDELLEVPYFATNSTINDISATICSPDVKSQTKCARLSFSDNCALKVSTGKFHLQTCQDPSMALPHADVFGWANAATSRCLHVGLPFVAEDACSKPVVYDPTHILAEGMDTACFRMTCDMQNNLFVHVDGNAVRCPTGEIAQLAGVGPYTQGSIGPCPSNEEVCAGLSCGPRACFPGGKCYKGKCHCHLQYGGDDCSEHLGMSASRSRKSSPHSRPQQHMHRERTVKRTLRHLL